MKVSQRSAHVEFRIGANRKCSIGICYVEMTINISCIGGLMFVIQHVCMFEENVRWWWAEQHRNLRYLFPRCESVKTDRRAPRCLTIFC